MLISKLKNSTPKLTCTGPGPTNTRDEVMVTGEFLGCTRTQVILDSSHHNNHHTHYSISFTISAASILATVIWSCGVVSTRYVSRVSGQWPVSTIGRNDTVNKQRHYKHTLATKYHQHTFTGDSAAKIYHIVAQHQLPT